MSAATAGASGRSRTRVLAALLALISVPALLALGEAVAFRAANRSNGFFISSGEEREYLLYVPPSYDRTTPTPLVITLHGGALWGAAQARISEWDRVADREGFIAVYPSGVRGDGPRHWSVARGSGRSRDVQFISELIDTVAAHYNIDPARVYANGLSNGGMMAFALSCRLSDRIAAVGMVGAALLVPWSWCGDRTPVPMIAFHGTADNAAPYHGGSSWVTTSRFGSIVRWTSDWALRNGCDARPTDTPVAADVSRRDYHHCVRDADVTLYTIDGGGHTWPGGGAQPEWFMGRTSRSVDASALMWEFFRDHPLRAP